MEPVVAEVLRSFPFIIFRAKCCPGNFAADLCAEMEEEDASGDNEHSPSLPEGMVMLDLLTNGAGIWTLGPIVRRCMAVLSEER